MSEPRILAVDTCFGACSVAVVQNDRVLAGQFVVMERGHAEALAPMVDAVMKTAGLSFADLDKLAVTTGPGTFTGQRVGLAFMRALRVALTKPLLGITSLSAMAEEARCRTGAPTGVAVHDAKRDEVYMEIIGAHACPAQLMKISDAEDFLRPLEDLAFAGTGAHHFSHTCRNATFTDIRAPDAVWVARRAARAPESSSPPRPLYLRAPDAKLPAAK